MTEASREDAVRFRAVVKSRLGLDFDDTKLATLAQVLGARMLATRASDVGSYLERLDGAELGALAERLTVGETYFFRYGDQFRALEEVALPTALRAHRRPVRIVSAGCSTGEEAYSLAIAAREHAAAQAEPIEVRAFDVNPAALAAAARACYSAWSLRETSQERRARWFVEDGTQHALSRGIRSMVHFEQRNLLADDPAFWQPDAFDIVFCRNVLMYLDAGSMRAVVGRLASSLRPGGFLFLGHAETLRGISTAFHLCHTHETFYYRRKGGRAPVLVSASPAADFEPSMAPASAAPGVGDASWADVIHRASERVAALASSRARDASAGAPPARAPADTKPVLDMLQRERFAEALELLGTPSPADPETQLLRAVLLTNGGRLREAEHACAELLAEDDLSAGAHYVMALCREHAGDRRAAQEHDRIAAYLDPSFAMPHLHLGLLQRREGDVEHAAAALSRALDLLASEDPSRILLFGGGFHREALVRLCRNELRRCGGAS